MSDVRNFALRDKEANEYGAFDEKQYHQSAFKAANRCKKRNSNRSSSSTGNVGQRSYIFSRHENTLSKHESIIENL